MSCWKWQIWFIYPAYDLNVMKNVFEVHQSWQTQIGSANCFQLAWGALLCSMVQWPASTPYFSNVIFNSSQWFSCFMPLLVFLFECYQHIRISWLTCALLIIIIMLQVRSTARMCFRLFAKTWPERSRQLFSSFHSNIQRVYMLHSSHYSMKGLV